MPPKRKRARKTDEENGPQTAGRGSEGEWLERHDHPLLNDVVLLVLFQYIKSHELMACRSVCKKWNRASLPLARSMLSVTIFGENLPSVSGCRCQEVLYNIGHNSLGNSNLDADACGVNNFVELFGSNMCLGIPFTNFNLGSFDPTIGAGKKFFELCGDKIKKIDLNRTREIHLVENVGEFLRLAPKLEYFKMPYTLQSRKGGSFNSFSDPKVPTLKCLKTLDMGDEIVHARRKCCPSFLEEFLTAAKNISTIATYETSSWDNVGLEVLKMLEEIGRESQIETLSLPSVEDEDLIAWKKMSGLKLKHMTARIEPFGVTRSFQFAELMKDNLISFQLRIDEDDTTPDYFPAMPKLKLLDLVLDAADEGVVLGNFSASFPALEYLKLDSSYEAIMSDGFLTGSDSCPMMKSLNLGNFKVKLQIFERTLTVFPTLKELELKIAVDGAAILQKIWTQMPQLEKLNICGRLPARNGAESLITGISSEEFMKIEQKLKINTLKNMTREARRRMILELIHEHKAYPSIGNLTSLRHLTLSITAGGRSLSEMAGYFGIYTLLNLRHLRITKCKFSKACSQILVADMELDSWNFERLRKTNIIPSRWNSDSDGGEWNFPSSEVLM